MKMRQIKAEEFITITLSLFLIVIPLSSALVCSYDNRPFVNNLPFYNDKVYVTCNVDNSVNYSCFTIVNSTTDENIIQLNPVLEYKDKLGQIASFKNENSLLAVYYTTKNLLAGGNYNVTVKCLDTTGVMTQQIFTIIPVLRNLDIMTGTGDRLVWTQENMSYIISIVLFGLIILGLIIILVKYH